MEGLFRYIFSLNFVVSLLRMSTPLLFVAMAAVVGAKADILCIAYEGMMLFAALGGVIASAYTQSLIAGALFGVLCGVLIAAIFGYFVLYLNTQPMLIGLALNILGSGGTVFILFMITGSKANSLSLPSLVFPNINIPFIENIPVLGKLLSGYNIMTYLAFICVFVVNWMIFRTKLGLRIRAVGENPAAAESVGINVSRTKMIAVLISGVLASIGGTFMSMGYISTFTRDMIAGRGFIGIAAQNLGKGNPIMTMLCTLAFGAADAFGIIGQSYQLPSQFASMAPYAVTILGLVLMNMTKGKKSTKAKILKNGNAKNPKVGNNP